jgi:hypothetical protein
MDEEIKKDLKKAAQRAEAKVAESLLRWKYKKDGRSLPDSEHLESQSRLIADQANQVIARHGRKVWHELKKAYRKRREEENSED